MKNRCWLIVIAVVAVTACQERPTGPEVGDLVLEPVFGKPDRVGKPSPDIPLTVVFTDEGTGIRSDAVRFGDDWPFASDTYVDGEHFVSARLKSIGQFYFQAFSGKKKDPVRRGVTVDLTEQVGEAMSQTDLDDFQAAVGPDWPVFTSDVTLHTRDYDGRIYDLEEEGEGSTLVDGGKIAFNDYGENWEWRLLFDTRVDGVADGVGLCVQWDGPNEWTITAEDGACGGLVDGITELWRVRDGDFIPVARFHTPMRLKLTGN